MKYTLAVLFFLCYVILASAQSSALGIKIDLGAIANPLSSYDNENPMSGSSESASLGICYSRILAKKWSLSLGLSRTKITGFNIYENDTFKDIDMIAVSPSFGLSYWFKDASKSGFFLNSGVMFPIIIDAEEEIYKTSNTSFRPMTIESGDFKMNTQKYFPHFTMGIGGQLNVGSKISLAIILSAVVNNNVIDINYGDKSITISQHLSARAFYRFQDKNPIPTESQ